MNRKSILTKILTADSMDLDIASILRIEVMTKATSSKKMVNVSKEFFRSCSGMIEFMTFYYFVFTF
jgi:hypothetical protein